MREGPHAAVWVRARTARRTGRRGASSFEGMENETTIPVAVRGDVDERAVEQLRRCANAGSATRAALQADGHVGYSQPIGGAVAYEAHVSPSGVGYDIGCGNKAVRTDVRYEDVATQIPGLMDEVVSRISFGVGRKNDEPVDHPVLDRIGAADFHPQRALKDMAAAQLGTVGSGNHYVNLFAGDDGFVWVGVHFGSRGFGHRTASGFLALAQGEKFNAKGVDGEMDSPPVLLSTDSDLGQAYISAMQLAGDYAYAGRDVVVDRVLGILGARATYEVHNHHNYAWREEHDGRQVWVIRKGCTPAFPGQEGFVGATMGEESVILRGTSDPAGPELLYSTVHGAGRVMSRTEAAGRRRKRTVCGKCGWTQPPRTARVTTCPSCGSQRDLSKRWVLDRPGKIDWPAVTKALAARGIVLRGGGADEAPDAYKRLDEVLSAQGSTIEILHRLRPVGVAMAGMGEFDPYKD